MDDNTAGVLTTLSCVLALVSFFILPMLDIDEIIQGRNERKKLKLQIKLAKIQAKGKNNENGSHD